MEAPALPDSAAFISHLIASFSFFYVEIICSAPYLKTKICARTCMPLPVSRRTPMLSCASTLPCAAASLSHSTACFSLASTPMPRSMQSAKLYCAGANPCGASGLIWEDKGASKELTEVNQTNKVIQRQIRNCKRAQEAYLRCTALIPFYGTASIRRYAMALHVAQRHVVLRLSEALCGSAHEPPERRSLVAGNASPLVQASCWLRSDLLD